MKKRSRFRRNFLRYVIRVGALALNPRMMCKFAQHVTDKGASCSRREWVLSSSKWSQIARNVVDRGKSFETHVLNVEAQVPHKNCKPCEYKFLVVQKMVFVFDNVEKVSHYKTANLGICTSNWRLMRIHGLSVMAPI